MFELHQAVASENYDLVLELLQCNKCNVNEKDFKWDCRTPLHWAAARGQTDMVRILIEHGARPCLRNNSGWTPAHFAAESGRLEVLQLLHSLHAPLNKEDCCGDKPVRIAEIYGHKDCVNFLKIAEAESLEYRKMAREKGIKLDDTDEEWEEQKRETGQNQRTQDQTNDTTPVPK